MYQSKRQLTELFYQNQQQSRFTINQRFGFVADMVNMVSKGDQVSVIVSGPGGLGKSYTVNEALEDSGLEDISMLDPEDRAFIDKESTYQVVKGYSTAKGLYRTLYENREGVLVFDDCDSVLKDTTSLNLLKAALDSYDQRIISWRADLKDADLPQVFEFKGRIIFISNMPSTALDQAILSRSMVVDLSMNTSQKVERMRYLLEQDGFMPEYTDKEKSESLDLIDTLKDEVKELSLRTLIQVTKIRRSAGKNWQDLAEYTICG
jgi:replication-associated recombination protein RarA